MKTKNSIDWADLQGVEHNIDVEIATINNKIDTEVATKVAKQFTDSAGAFNYVGINVETLAISSGTHIFTNCEGTINYSGNTAKVYVDNSPNLVLNGIDAGNEKNIYLNAVKDYSYLYNGSPSSLFNVSSSELKKREYLTVSVLFGGQINGTVNIPTNLENKIFSIACETEDQAGIYVVRLYYYYPEDAPQFVRFSVSSIGYYNTSFQYVDRKNQDGYGITSIRGGNYYV